MSLSLDSRVCVSESVPTARIRLHKRLIGVTAGVFAVVLPASVGHAAPDDGHPFTSPDGDFVIVFPDEPTDFSDEMPPSPGVDDFTVFATFDDAEQVMYMAGRVTTSAPGVPTEREIGITAEAFVTGMGGGELIHESRIEFRGAPGIEVTATPDPALLDGSVYLRLFFVGSTGYMAMVMGERPSISMKDPDVAAFVTSFDFVKDAF
jgi:hypothetical protein